jgi:hypothetical protein
VISHQVMLLQDVILMEKSLGRDNVPEQDGAFELALIGRLRPCIMLCCFQATMAPFFPKRGSHNDPTRLSFPIFHLPIEQHRQYGSRAQALCCMGIHETRRRHCLLPWQNVPFRRCSPPFLLVSLHGALAATLPPLRSFQCPAIFPASMDAR